LFPGFAEYHTLAELEESERDDTATLHSVMSPFTQFFGGHQSASTDKQLKALSALLNDAVSVDDELENAVSTCFLEHLRQIRSYKVLVPYLSAMAKRKTHA
jgi:hypothetical protein